MAELVVKSGSIGADNPVCGVAYRQHAGQGFNDIVAGAGTGAYTTEITLSVEAAASANQWAQINRGFILFDTSALGASATVSAVTLSMYYSAHSNPYFADTTPFAVHVIASNPAATDALSASDFSLCSGTSFGSRAWDDIITGGARYVEFTLNASGIAAINTTGITKFGLRFNCDITSTEPYWEAGASLYVTMSADDDVGHEPKLTITYSAPPSVTVPSNTLTLSGTADTMIDTAVIVPASTLSLSGSADTDRYANVPTNELVLDGEASAFIGLSAVVPANTLTVEAGTIAVAVGEVVSVPTSTLIVSTDSSIYAYIGDSSFALDLPAITFVPKSGGLFTLDCPTITMEADSDFPPTGVFDLTIPTTTLVVQNTGGVVEFNVPLPIFSMSARVTGAFALDTPALSLSMAMTVPATGVFNLNTPLTFVNNFTGDVTLGTLNLNLPITVFGFTGGTARSGGLDLYTPAILFGLRTLTADPFVMVMNMDNGAGPTFYDNFVFNSMFQFGSDVYLATTAGMCKITGMDDEGTDIDAFIDIPETDLRTAELKRMNEITVGVNGGILQIQTSHDGTLTTAQETLDTGSELITRRITPAKGLKQRYWGVKISNKDGSSFVIDDITLHPVTTSRRVNQ